jgi:mannose-6-phosphate isomerase
VPDLYPLLCRPTFVPRIWGGRRLARLFAKPLPPEQPIGESWEVADLPEGQSWVANGPYEGYGLTEVTAELGSALLGAAWPEGRFPLLVKLLDANDDLSVQVHPSAEDCARWFPEARSKDESWVVIDAEPGAGVYFGFKPGVRPADFEAELGREGLVNLLQRVAVRPGDVLRCAPGTVHALGRGVAVLEVQEPSDTTFRIHDFGRGRPVHIAQAQLVTKVESAADPRLAPIPTETEWGVHEVLVDVPAYRLERAAAEADLTWMIDPRSVEVLCLLEGLADLVWEHGAISLAAGDHVILPALLGEVRLEPRAALVAVLAGAGGVPMLGVASG